MAALGDTWILDGLEVTLAGSHACALKGIPVLRFSNSDVGLAASAYLAGAVLMVLGGLVAWRWGVPAERKPLELVVRPLTFIDID